MKVLAGDVGCNMIFSSRQGRPYWLPTVREVLYRIISFLISADLLPNEYLASFLIINFLMMAVPAYLSTGVSLHSNASNLFSQLPTELKAHIINFLSARDVTNLRLASKAWGGVCVTGLFNISDGRFIEQGVFSIRPHLDDMTRLRCIASLPWLAKVIKNIKIYLGDLNPLEFEHEVQNVNNHTKIESRSESQKRVGTLKEQVARNRRTHCDLVMLSHSLSLLPAVRSVTVTSTECPFHESEVNFTLAWNRLVQRWNREPDVLYNSYDSYDITYPPPSINDHLSILLSLQRLQQPLKELVLDSLPADIFGSDDFDDDEHNTGQSSRICTQFLQNMKALTFSVQDLRIDINSFNNHSSTHKHTPVLAKSMNMFIGSMKFLRSLDICLNMSSRFPNQSMESPNQEGFYSHTFPHLENLRLSTMRSCETQFHVFISRHKNTLQSLSLGPHFFLVPEHRPRGCASFKSVLFRLRNEGGLMLERFQLLVGAGDGEIYDREWRDVEPDGLLQDAKLFELFVLGKWAWPMVNGKREFPHWRKLDEWRGWVRRGGWERLKMRGGVRSKGGVRELEWKEVDV